MILSKYDSTELIKPIARAAAGWLNDNGFDPMGTGSAGVAAEFATRIIKQEPTWTLPDVICFFDFISSNQHDDRLKFYGANTTPLHLLKMVSAYEEKKAEAREELLAEKNYPDPSDLVSAIAQSGKIDPTKMLKNKLDNPISMAMGKEFEKVQTANLDIKVVYDAPADEKYFSRKPVNPDKQ